MNEMSWKKVKLGELLTESRIPCDNPSPDRRIKVKLKVLGVEKRGLENEIEGATKQFIRKAGQFIYGKQNFHKGAFGIIPEELDGFESSADLPAFDVSDKCLPEWIFYYFKQGNYYLELSKIARGVATQRIHPEQIYDLEIPLPELKIQKEILKRIYSLENNGFLISNELTHQLSLVKKLRRQLLQDAVQGKLLAKANDENEFIYPPDKSGGNLISGSNSKAGNNSDKLNRNVALAHSDNNANKIGFSQIETGQELLEKIKVEKAKIVGLKPGKSRINRNGFKPIDAKEIPFKIPENWVWCRLEGIANNIEYGTSEKADLNSDNIPILRMNNIQDGKLDLENLKFVKSSIEDLPKLYLKNNDLLFNRTNSWELVGKSGVYHGKDDIMTFASYLIRVQFEKIVSVDFINAYINSSLCRTTQLEPNIIQQNGQANFNGTKLKNIICPLPPLFEQTCIVQKLDELMQYCNELEASIKESRAQNEKLLQQVLREALRQPTVRAEKNAVER